MVLKYASLFSGIGGFEYGIQKAISSADCVYSCEADKYARAIYRKQFKQVTSDDVRTVRGQDIQKVDLICGGPPCQDFSIAGKRCGLEGERSGLMLEFIRIVRETKPKHILIENVKGILSSNGGWDFAKILIELESIGYCVEWQVLNSKNFDVPQHRERVYIVGHLGAFRGRKVFPIQQSNPKNPIRNEEKRLIDLQYHKGYSSLYAGCSGVLVHSLFPRSSNTNNGGTGQLSKINQTFCIDANQNQAVQQNDRIRRFTPLEIERLQAFPDYFTVKGENEDGDLIDISDTQRYKCLGNAVTTNVITAIISELYNVSIDKNNITKM